MPYQEKKTISEIVSTVLTFGGYSLYVYHKYLNADPEIVHNLVYWAKAFLWLIPTGIAGAIFISIITSIFHKIISPEENIPVFLDERDKLIELKTQQIAGWIFILGVFLAMTTVVFGLPAAALFIIIAISGFISNITASTLQIIYYRKGF